MSLQLAQRAAETIDILRSAMKDHPTGREYRRTVGRFDPVK
jgi:hypothetical protein